MREFLKKRLKETLVALEEETFGWRFVYIGFALAILVLSIKASFAVPLLVLGLVAFAGVTFFIVRVVLPWAMTQVEAEASFINKSCPDNSDSEKLE